MRSASVLLCFAAGCSVPSDPPAPPAARPNVLFLAIDDLRPELGCYGAAHARTPAIDGLAKSGVLFERAYCQSAVCNPSRASVLTGRYPESVGVLDLNTDLREVSPEALTLPQHLRKAGYYTASVGKIFHNIFPDEPSWDERHYVDGFPFDPDAVYAGEKGLAIQRERIEKWTKDGALERRRDRFGHIYVKAQATEGPDVSDAAYYDAAQTDWAVDRLTGLAASEQPFMLAVGFYRPHLPFNAPKSYWDMYDRASLPLPDAARTLPVADAPPMAMNNMRELRGYTDFRQHAPPGESSFTEAEHRRLLHGYLASVSYVDAQVGRLLERLEELGLADNTVVVLWSDHGWKLGEYGSYGKMTNYEVDTRVPVIIRAPGAQSRGARVQGLVELVDLFPTLCELAGVAVPESVEGRSVVGLLDGDGAVRDHAHSIYLRKGIWIGPTGKPAIGRAVRTDRYRLVEWRSGEGLEQVCGVELYDHEADPHESRNLAAVPDYAAVVERLLPRVAPGAAGR
ncbi:MAG: sulfatase [Planctomycetota bacterium]